MRDTVVLDAAALLGLLLDEPGAATIVAMLPGAAICFVDHSEVVAKPADAGGRPERIERLMRALHPSVVPFDESLALSAGPMRPLTRAHGLSLGDRAC